MAIIGDAKLVLQELTKRYAERGKAKGPAKERRKELIDAKKAYEEKVKAECDTDEMPLKTKRVIRELNAVFGENTILVNENGSQDLWSYYCPYYKVLDVNACVTPGEQTCMGGGVAAAIGAKLAEPGMKVACTTGDGAFQMFMKELPTAVQYEAPVTFVVLNNFSLGWVKFSQKRRGNPFVAADFTSQPDFARVARACQCHGERVEQPADIRGALERALNANTAGKPAVVEFIVDGWDFAPGFKRFYEKLE